MRYLRFDLIAFATIVGLLLPQAASSRIGAMIGTGPNLPFWTERTTYVEGDRLYVVGISNFQPDQARARLQASERARDEIRAYLQVEDISSLTLETQRNYEVESGGQWKSYRLMHADLSQAHALKTKRTGRLSAGTRVTPADSRSELTCSLRVGMTEKDVRKKIGKPDRVDSGFRNVWYYGRSTVIFFSDGVRLVRNSSPCGQMHSSRTWGPDGGRLIY